MADIGAVLLVLQGLFALYVVIVLFCTFFFLTNVEAVLLVLQGLFMLYVAVVLFRNRKQKWMACWLVGLGIIYCNWTNQVIVSHSILLKDVKLYDISCYKEIGLGMVWFRSLPFPEQVWKVLHLSTCLSKLDSIADATRASITDLASISSSLLTPAPLYASLHSKTIQIAVIGGSIAWIGNLFLLFNIPVVSLIGSSLVAYAFYEAEYLLDKTIIIQLSLLVFLSILWLCNVNNLMYSNHRENNNTSHPKIE